MTDDRSALRDDQVRDALESALTVLELIAANRKGELMSNVETRHGSFVNVIDTILACRAALAATRPADEAEIDRLHSKLVASPLAEQARSASTLPPELRRCGHPLGDTSWCPDCSLIEARESREFR